MNHVLEFADGYWGCTVCGVKWSFLTERDRRTLTTEGKCIGEPERWRPCKVQPSCFCLGVKPGHRGVCL